MKIILVIISSLIIAIPCNNICFSYSKKQVKSSAFSKLQGNNIITGAERLSEYINLLKNKRVGIIANNTSVIGNTHLVDSLINLKIDVKKIFCPEHGFRGDYDAGEIIGEEIDKKTGIPIISLYNENKKPQKDDLKNIDVLLFDIQDVGVRFYTYISTLHYVMEAAAENDIPLILLDRPNPNGFYIDGPLLEPKYTSFVGMHKVPIIYGMTIGEYAQMINGELWLKNKVKCKLTCIKLQNYTHQDYYDLPIKPSPNLPNISAIYLYPSLCLFEGTAFSVGRGTEFPFQMIGHPKYSEKNFYFIPKSMPKMARKPLWENKKCYGYDFRNLDKQFLQNRKKIDISILIKCYKNFYNKKTFFNNTFNLLAGNSSLKNQIISGISEDKIRESWQEDIEKFKKIRIKYLLYP